MTNALTFFALASVVAPLLIGDGSLGGYYGVHTASPIALAL